MSAVRSSCSARRGDIHLLCSRDDGKTEQEESQLHHSEVLTHQVFLRTAKLSHGDGFSIFGHHRTRRGGSRKNRG